MDLLLYECNICMLQTVNKDEIAEHVKEEHNIKDAFWNEFNSITTYKISSESDEVNENELNDAKLWTKGATLALIEEVKSRKEDFEKTLKKIVWSKIADKISNDQQKTYTAKHCESKWKALKRTYKSTLDHNNSTGKNRRKWEYFEPMHAFLFSKPEINPPAMCSSSSGLLTSSSSGLLTKREERAVTPVHEDSEIEFMSKRKRKLSLADIRHKDKMLRQDKFLELFQTLIDKM